MPKSPTVALATLVGAAGALFGTVPATASDAATAPATAAVEQQGVATTLTPTAVEQQETVLASRERVIGVYDTQRECLDSGRRLGGDPYRCAKDQYGKWMLIVPRI